MAAFWLSLVLAADSESGAKLLADSLLLLSGAFSAVDNNLLRTKDNVGSAENLRFLHPPPLQSWESWEVEFKSRARKPGLVVGWK